MARQPWRRPGPGTRNPKVVTTAVAPEVYERIVDVTHEKQITIAELMREWILEGLEREQERNRLDGDR